jgi:hypothetical protein
MSSMVIESGILRPIATLLDGVWRLFTDLRTTLAMLMLAAAILVLSVLLPGAAGEGPALRVALAALAFSLALRLAMHVERAARLWSGRYAPPEPGLPVETVTLEEPPAEAQSRAESTLAANYDRVIAEGISQVRLLGIRRIFGTVGPILAASGALLVLLGLLINATWGQTAREAVLTEGETVPVGSHGLSLGLRAGAPALAIAQNGGAPAHYAIAPLRPALSGLHWILPRADGPTLQVSATDAAARPLLLLGSEAGATAGAELNLPFRANQAEQTFTSPDQGLAFRAVSYPALPERGVTGPVLLVEAYREGRTEPVLSELVQDRAALTVNDATYLLRRGRYLTVDVAYAPGWPALMLGGLAAIVGLAIAFFLPAEEAWVDLHGGGRRSIARIRTTGGLAPGRASAALVDALREPDESRAAEGGRP